MLYDELLTDAPLQRPAIQGGAGWNYAYYPVMFTNESAMLHVKERLGQHSIHPRRYFYPSLDTLEYVQAKEAKVSTDISKRILCLPLYHGLKPDEQSKISAVIGNSLAADQRTIS